MEIKQFKPSTLYFAAAFLALGFTVCNFERQNMPNPELPPDPSAAPPASFMHTILGLGGSISSVHTLQRVPCCRILALVEFLSTFSRTSLLFGGERRKKALLQLEYRRWDRRSRTCDSFLQACAGHIDSTVSVIYSHYSAQRGGHSCQSMTTNLPTEKLQHRGAGAGLGTGSRGPWLHSSPPPCLLLLQGFNQPPTTCSVFTPCSWRPSTPSSPPSSRTTSSPSSTCGTTSGPRRTWTAGRSSSRP